MSLLSSRRTHPRTAPKLRAELMVLEASLRACTAALRAVNDESVCGALTMIVDGAERHQRLLASLQ